MRVEANCIENWWTDAKFSKEIKFTHLLEYLFREAVLIRNRDGIENPQQMKKEKWRFGKRKGVKANRTSIFATDLGKNRERIQMETVSNSERWIDGIENKKHPKAPFDHKELIRSGLQRS